MTPKEVVNALEYLRQKGVPFSLVNRLHHNPKRPQTYEKSIDYFSKAKSLQKKNTDLGYRLCFIMEQCRDGRTNFEKLIAEATMTWPIEYT